jgi:hypothetical protein
MTADRVTPGAIRSPAVAGAAIYTKGLLSLYDLAVIGVSNRLVWRCPARRTLAFYREHLSANHLEQLDRQPRGA